MKFYTSVSRLGGNILHRGYEDGKPFIQKEKYQPYIFLADPKSSNPKYQTLNGTGVSKLEFDDMWEMKKWTDQHKDVHNFKFYGSKNPVTTFIYDNYPGEIKFDPSLVRVGIIDIECDGLINGDDFIDVAPVAITSIALKIGHRLIALGMKEFKAPEGVKYFKCQDEETLLKTFLTIWEGARIDILSGWNIVGFDIPYLINRIIRLLGIDEAKRLSPWNHIQAREFKDRYKKKRTYEITGISILDYMELYKKFTLQVHGQLESYSLNFVSSFELNEKKTDYSEYGSLKELYDKDFQKFIEYNLKDVVLVQQLDDKLMFFNLVYEMAYIAKCNYTDVLKTIPVWENLIHAYLLDQRTVVPVLKMTDLEMTIPGGFVKEPTPGLYDWIISFDVASLYPTLIQNYNLSPETYRGKMSIPDVDKLVDGESFDTKGYSVAATGCYYTHEKKGFLPVLMKEIFDRRAIYKKEMIEAQKEYESAPSHELGQRVASLKAKQQAYKILANSGYGALANQYFSFFSYDLAMSITMSGQLTIKWVAARINEYMNELMKTENVDYIISIDTDSNYLNCAQLVKRLFPKETDKTKIVNFLDTFAEKKIQPVIDKAFADLAVKMNAFDPCLKMKRESISERGLWSGKKRYVLNVLDNEGVRYDSAKMKVTGLEVVRSSVPQVCRDALKKAMWIILTQTNDDLISFVEEFDERYRTLDFYDVAFPRGMNGLNEYFDPVHTFKPKCPIHVRGAIVYNEWVKKHKLSDKYPLINDGEKIKFCYIKVPNALKSNVISCSTKIPDELKILDVIDYKTQYDKSFREPLQGILNIINWSMEKENTLF
mgnify:CR=1 FL=1|tara:strand:- start:27388 stop:29865 length:2478 start_codon:yes stop_codon:yes gene_type:complete